MTVIVALLICLFPSAEPVTVMKVYAAKTTQQQIDEAENRKEELENQLDQKNDQLNGLKGEQKGLKKELNALNEKLQEVVANLESLEQQIADKEAEILTTQAELEEAKATEAWQYKCMVIRIRDMYEQNDRSYINALFSWEGLASFLNAPDYFEYIASYDHRKMEEYIAARTLVEEKEALLQQEKLELDALKLEAETQKARVNGLISQTSNSIAQYESEIDAVEKEALAFEKQIKEQEKDLKALRKKLAEEIALSQAAQNAAWRDISEINFAEGDRYLLANLIYCEAGGEPYEGQVAVGAVVINRVLSSRYPDTVVGVIYQKSQFSPVASGRLAYALSVNKATEKCYRAADEAMAGKTNVGTCLYFRTPIPGLNGINIGGHVFY